jgi:hypothetical protein
VGERFLMKMQGGPCDEQVRVAATDKGWTWPLPDVLAYPDGSGEYVKVSESQLPPPSTSTLVRGAVYQWQEAGT